MFRIILKKPIFSCSLLCLLLSLATGIFFSNGLFSVSAAYYVLLSSIIIFCNINLLQKLESAIICLVFFLFFLLLKNNLILLLGEISAVFLVWWHRRQQEDAFAFLVIAVGFLFHLFYIQKIPVDYHQHDFNGIKAYMSVITQNGFNLFRFDPWYMYYFFHQPLHFLMMGYIYAAEYQLWGSNIIAKETLQYLSLFYVTTSSIVASGIFKELSLRKMTFYACLLLFTFNPTLFLFSGYVSDDTPVFFWTILFIYFILRWYKSDDIHYIVYAALCFGLGTLTKLSILIVVPAVALLFIHKLFTTSVLSTTLKALSLFTIIAVPLSLFWIIRNHILFDMQFYNIPDTSPWGQSFKYQTFGERIGNFSHIFEPFINAPLISDNNMFLALIKTELFGEWDLSINHPFLFIFGFVFYVLNLFIKLFAWISGSAVIAHFCRKKETFVVLFFALIYFITWGYSFKYAMDYPFVCSTDYRLFATLILPEVILLGKITYNNHSKLFLTMGIIYTFLSCFIYTFSL